MGDEKIWKGEKKCKFCLKLISTKRNCTKWKEKVWHLSFSLLHLDITEIERFSRFCFGLGIFSFVVCLFLCLFFLSGGNELNDTRSWKYDRWEGSSASTAHSEALSEQFPFRFKEVLQTKKSAQRCWSGCYVIKIIWLADRSLGCRCSAVLWPQWGSSRHNFDQAYKSKYWV